MRQVHTKSMIAKAPEFAWITTRAIERDWHRYVYSVGSPEVCEPDTKSASVKHPKSTVIGGDKSRDVHAMSLDNIL